MNENVIMNDEVMSNVAEDAIEVCTANKSAKMAKTAVGISVATFVGFLLYKKVVKPAVAKVKAKRAAKGKCDDVAELEDDEPIKPIFDENGNAIED